MAKGRKQPQLDVSKEYEMLHQSIFRTQFRLVINLIFCSSLTTRSCALKIEFQSDNVHAGSEASERKADPLKTPIT
jgi:hypothetical protein